MTRQEKDQWPWWIQFTVVAILALAIALLVVMLASAQDTKKSWDVTRKGFYQLVVDGQDTLASRFLRYDTAVNYADRYADTARVQQIEIVGPRFIYQPTYGPVPRDTVFLHRYDPLVRNINWAIYQDTTMAPREFRLIIQGTTDADRVRFASKCIGYDSTMTAIDQRVGLYMTPDTTGAVQDTTGLYTCYKQNALMTYWLTAWKDTVEVVDRFFIDVAHVLSIGGQ